MRLHADTVRMYGAQIGLFEKPDQAMLDDLLQHRHGLAREGYARAFEVQGGPLRKLAEGPRVDDRPSTFLGGPNGLRERAPATLSDAGWIQPPFLLLWPRLF